MSKSQKQKEVMSSIVSFVYALQLEQNYKTIEEVRNMARHHVQRLIDCELEPYLHVKNPDGTDYNKEQKA